MYLIISTDKNSCFSVARAKSKIEKIVTVKKPFKQTELLLKNISSLIDFKKVKGIIVNQGPGEFSALRIGISTANALAFALSLPIVGICLKVELEATEKEKIELLWQSGKSKITKVKSSKIILPYYDKEPNITVKK
ncbi:MAG: Universal protein YeaZ [Parcubacteria group bacterium GW2011_GWC2_39_14]|nr:MAG: Universal protein YeaZ [Parcubacteria group bacterium GW2011_GWC2_39_14]KKR54466.1 MAG: Universal protein YeaZ [Parcubacteria group bacterium GW2011_GWA2_40_23]